MKVICISGHAQHGKDTMAKTMSNILRGFGKSVLIIHNADLLKFMCKQLFSWNGKKDERGRTLLQYVGTDVIRTKRPDYWASYIADVLSLFDKEWDYVLIPDCRFPNEIGILKDRGFDVVHVRIVRDNFDNGLTDEQKTHPSETALDGTTPDVSVHNNGTLVDLYRDMINLVPELADSDDVVNLFSLGA